MMSFRILLKENYQISSTVKDVHTKAKKKSIFFRLESTSEARNVFNKL